MLLLTIALSILIWATGIAVAHLLHRVALFAWLWKYTAVRAAVIWPACAGAGATPVLVWSALHGDWHIVRSMLGIMAIGGFLTLVIWVLGSLPPVPRGVDPKDPS